MGVQGVDEYYFAEFIGSRNRWWWINPLSKETTIEGMKIVSGLVSYDIMCLGRVPCSTLMEACLLGRRELSKLPPK